MPARQFTFRISAEGLEDLRRQLEALGPVGQQAFGTLTQATRGFTAATDQAQTAAERRDRNIARRLEALTREAEALERLAVAAKKSEAAYQSERNRQADDRSFRRLGIVPDTQEAAEYARVAAAVRTYQAELREATQARIAATQADAQAAAAARALVDRLDPVATAQRRLAEETALLTRFQRELGLSSEQHAVLVGRLNSQYGALTQSGRLASHQVANLGQQVADVAIQLQAGVNPFTILLQQGSQAAFALGGVRNALALVRAGLTSLSAFAIANPLIAVAAAATAAGAAYLAFRPKAKTAEEAAKDFDNAINATRKTVGDFNGDINKLSDSFNKLSSSQKEAAKLSLEAAIEKGKQAIDTLNAEILEKLNEKSIIPTRSTALSTQRNDFFGSLYEQYKQNPDFNSLIAELSNGSERIRDLGKSLLVEFGPKVTDATQKTAEFEAQLRILNGTAKAADYALAGLAQATRTVDSAIASYDKQFANKLRLDEVSKALDIEVAAGKRSKESADKILADLAASLDDAGKKAADFAKKSSEAVASLTRQADASFLLADAYAIARVRGDDFRAGIFETAAATKAATEVAEGQLAAVDELAARQAELRAQATSALAQQAERNLSLSQEVEFLREQANATDVSAAALAELARQQDVAKVAAELRAKAEASGSQDVLDSINEEVAAYDELTKQQTALKAAIEARQAVFALTADLDLAQRELSLVRETETARTRALALYRAEIDLKRRGVDLTSQQAQAELELTRRLVDTQAELARQRAAIDELGRFGEQAFDRIGEAITEAFVQGGDEAVNFGSVLKGVLSEFSQEALKLAVFNPLKNSLFGQNNPTAGSVLGSLTGGSGGGLGSLLGSGGPLGFLSQPIFGGGAPATGPGGLLVGGGATSSGAVSGGGFTIGQGIGALGGLANGIASLTSGNTVQGITALVGTAASFIPGIGSFLGPALQAAAPLLQGLFGAPKPPNRSAGATFDPLQGRIFNPILDDASDKTLQQRSAAIQTVSQALQSVYNVALDLRRIPRASVVFGERDPTAITVGRRRLTAPVGDVEQASFLITREALRQSRGLNGDARRALRFSTDRTAEGLAADVNFGQTFRQQLGLLKSGLDPVKSELVQITRAANENGRALRDFVKDFRANARELHLSSEREVQAALRTSLRAMLGLGAARQPLTESGRAIEAINANVRSFRSALLAAGYSAGQATDIIDRATRRQTRQVGLGFVEGVSRTLADLTSDTTYQRRAIQDQYNTRVREAADLLRRQAINQAEYNRVLLEAAQIRDLETQAIQRQIAAQQQEARNRAAEAAAGVVGDIRDLIRNLTYGDASPLPADQRFFSALTEFNRTSTLARNDFGAAQQFTGSAETLLNAARGLYGSGQGYANIVNQVLQQASALASADTNQWITLAQRYQQVTENQTNVLAGRLDDLRRALERIESNQRLGLAAPARAANFGAR